MLSLGLQIGNVRRKRAGITLNDIFANYSWRNMWSGENGTDDGTTLTAIDYAGIDNLSNPALANKPTITTLNGKYAVQYDGVDDYLIKNVSNWRSSDTEGQLIAVIKTGSDVTNYQPIFATSDIVDNTNKLSLAVYQGEFQFTVSNGYLTGNIFTFATVAPNTEYIVTVKSTGSSYECTVNSVTQTLTFSRGVNDGKWLSYSNSRDNITAGGIIQKTPFYASITVGFTGYAPSTEPTYNIVNDLNSYYHIF